MLEARGDHLVYIVPSRFVAKRAFHVLDMSCYVEVIKQT